VSAERELHGAGRELHGAGREPDGAGRESDTAAPAAGGPPGGLVVQAFANAVVRLHCAMRGPEGARAEGRADESLLAHWARRAWLAAADGHAFVTVPDASERARLADSPAVAAVGTGGEIGAEDAAPAAPLVVDGDALYLQRLWRAESVLADRLAALDAPAPLADEARAEATLDAVAPQGDVDPLQREAVRTALSRRLAIVTGGPGTGKTTTMARLLVACLRLAPEARVAIAAPTGKAAARLAQALGAQLATLDPDGSLAGRLPASGMTVHRLLGLRGDDSGPAPGARRYDLLIVDEASMLDLELARALVEAIPDRGRLVLAGDRDQLASVEAGAVFAEACASPLQAVVRLQRNYRQSAAPGLAAFAAWLRDRWQAPDAPMPTGVDGVTISGPASANAIADRSLAAWSPALDALARGEPAERIAAAFDTHRVLCAMREGPLGASAINAAIAARIRRRVGAAPGAIWYTGRIVIVTRNRPELGLFNGDVGICLADAAGGLAVAFDAGGALRWQPVRQMPAHDDAFAITVHKSQGSEFDTVALVPAPVGHGLNTRELLYTGATRARSGLQVWADAHVIEDGASRRTQRHGRLADRIAARGRP
jgi:exodeoxyribonuclease V alpha subunit